MIEIEDKRQDPTMSPEDFLVTVQLSHLLATDLGVSGDEATIIDAIYCIKEAITDSNLQSEISEHFHISIDQERVNKTLEKLLKEKKLYHFDNRILISPQTLQDINNVIANNEKTEQIALSEWIEQFRVIYGDKLSPESIDAINGCILNFIKTLFLKHGVDCYSAINGAKHTGDFDIEKIADECVQKISIDRKDMMFLFLTRIFSIDLSGSQKSLLLSQFKKAVNYISMVFDKGARDALVHQLDQTTIYLDTTILYRLFNLQGEKRYTSIKSLLTFCRDANVSLKVFQVSVDELRRRINYDARVITEHQTPVSFSNIGYKCRSSENYISTFWKEQSETGISAKDFNFMYSNVRILLAEHQIEIDDYNYIEEFGLEQKKSDLRTKVDQCSGYDPEDRKSSNAIDHDAECLAIVEYLQINNVTSAIEGKTLFLSSDWSLIRFQRYDHEYKSKPDLVVLPSQLMQIFCTTSPTTDYCEAFLGLFSSSSTSFGTCELSNAQIQEIMGRVAKYKGTTPAFAEKVLTNQLIQSSFAKKETNEEKTEMIDDVIVSEVEHMEEALVTKGVEIEIVKSVIANKEDRIEELSKRISTLEEKDDTNSDKLTVAASKISKYQKHFETQSRKKSKTQTIIRYVGGWFLIVIGITILIVSLAALLPFSSHYVAPFFSWLASSEVVGKESNFLELLAVFTVFAVPAISAGIICIKPGYSNLLKLNYDKQMGKLEPVLLTQEES